MCTVCGCASDNTTIEGESKHGRYPYRGQPRTGAAIAWRRAPNEASAEAPATEIPEVATPEVAVLEITAEGGAHHCHDYGQGPAQAHVGGLSQARMVKIEQDILGKNNTFAAENRRWLAERGVFAVNLVSSPGSGKTTVLTETIRALGDALPLAVIEGDQQTSQDAERIRATGAPAIQINTGKGCHLDASMVGRALNTLPIAANSVLFIENVGNLVCPAGFDLGEAHKVVMLSVTEGEDKPLKYPDMFAAADVMLLTKIDLLPYLEFDVAACLAFARQVNPRLRVFELSARTGAGMADWLAWLRAGVGRA